MTVDIRYHIKRVCLKDDRNLGGTAENSSLAEQGLFLA